MTKVGSGGSLQCCIFCYKKVNCLVKCEQDGAVDLQGHGDEDENGVSSGSLELQKFITVTERHLGKRFEDSIVVEGEGGGGKRLRELVKCCGDCLRSVRIFNECYHEYKCLELKLAWRLESVRNVMRFADRVPSRVKAFREGLEGDGNLEGHYDAATRFRQKILSYCSEHLRASFPRVKLHRTKTPTTFKDIDEFPECSKEGTENPEKLISDDTCSIGHHPVGRHQDDKTEGKPVGTQDYDGISDGHFLHFLDSESSHEDAKEDIPTQETNVNHGTVISAKDCLKVEAADVGDTDAPSSSLQPPIQDQEIPESDNWPPIGAKGDSSVPVKILTSEHDQELSSLEKAEGEPNDGPRRLRKMIQCPSCPIKFSNASRLDFHQKSEHLEKEHDEDNERDGRSSEMSQSSFDEDGDTTGTDDDDEDGPPLTKKIKRELNVSIGELRLEGIPEKELEHRNDDLRCKYDGCSALKFNFPSELEKHSKFHGEFRCEKCGTVKDFAADFALHQLEHASPGTEKQTGHLCWKCGRRFKSQAFFVQHFIFVHLEDLSTERNHCQICQKSFCGAFPIPASHYADNHDLNRLESCSKPFDCNKGRCRAYFLEDHQRNIHRNRDGHPCTNSTNVSNKRSSTASCSKSGTKRVYPAHVIVTCPKCPQTMQSSVLKYHMEMRHPKNPGGKPLKPSDKLITANGVTRKLEDWVTRKGARYRCTVESCSQAYFTEFELQIHSKTHGTFSCGICEESCGSATQLASHELEHSLVAGNGDESGPNFRDNFKCPRCPFKNASHDKYVGHFLKTHLGLEMDCVRCPICMAPLLGYTGRKRVGMFRHFLDQHNLSGDSKEKVEKCEQCPAYFLDKFRLDDHVKLMHTSEPPCYPCRNCGKGFSKKLYLEQHKKRLTCGLVEEQFQFPCTANESCGRRFETELELERHTPICKFFIPQECPRCGKTFRGEGGLASHMKTHDKSGEKDGILKAHVCHECGRAFRGSDGLKHHLFFHRDPESWEFECSVCSKKCPDKYKLAAHMRTHTQEKPYVCQTCGVKYAHLHNLRNHRRTKHGIDEGRKVADTSNCASRRKGKKLKKRVENEGDPDDEDGAL